MYYTRIDLHKKTVTSNGHLETCEMILPVGPENNKRGLDYGKRY